MLSKEIHMLIYRRSRRTSSIFIFIFIYLFIYLFILSTCKYSLALLHVIFFCYETVENIMKTAESRPNNTTFAHFIFLLKKCHSHPKLRDTLRETCSYLEFSRSVFSRIQPKCGNIRARKL